MTTPKSTREVMDNKLPEPALPCPHGRQPMDGIAGWHHCPHCLGMNQPTVPKQIKRDFGRAIKKLGEGEEGGGV